jgi:membrane-associated phospholipid phosphatase
VALDSSLTTSFYNELAAVPSLHAGFAAAVSVALAVALRRRWAKLLALSWGPAVGLAVVATGNHFVFDIAAGLVVTVAGYGLGVCCAWESRRDPAGPIARRTRFRAGAARSLA